MKPIQSIQRAVRILEVIAQKKNGYKVTEIAKHVELKTTTVHNILSTLCELGMAKQVEMKYCLGPKTLQLGSRYLESLTLNEIAYPVVQDLVDEFNESFFIVTIENHHQFYFLIQIDCNHNVKATRVAADKSASHATAVGKVLLSSFDAQELEEFIEENNLLKPFTKNTITDRDKLIQELEQVRKNGYALDREENDLGIFCVATPIYDHHKNIIAALGTSIPIQRLSSDFLEDVRIHMLESAYYISSNLGYV